VRECRSDFADLFAHVFSGLEHSHPKDWKEDECESSQFSAGGPANRKFEVLGLRFTLEIG
jgi:hypothetical protein